MPDPELKPCPRCEKVEAQMLGGPRPQFYGYRVACKACGLTGLKFWRTRKSAAVWWNKRFSKRG